MSELNPYEKFLDGRPVETILALTPNAIGEYLEVIGAHGVNVAPAPGKWSAAEIVCHLADCEMVFGFRLRQTLAEDGPTIQPFDQEKWAATYHGVTRLTGARNIHRAAQVESGADSRGAAGGGGQDNDASRAGRDDLSDPRGNNGRTRSESPGAVAQDRERRRISHTANP